MLYKKTWLEKVIFLKRKGGGGGTPAHEATSYTGSFFTDMVAPLKKLLVSFLPKQDLHGYDKPWAGGAGVNKFGDYTVINSYMNSSGVLQPSPSDRTYIIKALPSTQYAYKFVRIPKAGASVNDDYQIGEYYGDNRPEVGDVGTRIEAAGYANNIGTGTFTTSTSAKWIAIKLANIERTDSEATASTAQVEIGSSVSTSWTPYSNICPISGHTEVVAEVCGVNVWDEEWELGDISGSNGSNIPASAYCRSKNYIPILNMTYYFKIPSRVWVHCYDSDKNYVSLSSAGYRMISTSSSQAFPSNVRYIRFVFGGTTYNHDISINYPSTDHDYHAYDGNTYTTTLGRTVYGDTLDVVSGELVVDKGFAVFDGSETWTKNTRALNAFYTARPQGCKQGTTMVSDKFVYVDNVQTLYNTYGACFTGSSMNFNVNPETIGGDTIEDWKAWLVNNPLQVVYELATPQTYQLTPQQINSLNGQNNVITEDGAEVSEVVYMTHLVGGSLLGGSMSSPNSEDESEEPVEEIEESGE